MEDETMQADPVPTGADNASYAAFGKISNYDNTEFLRKHALEMAIGSAAYETRSDQVVERAKVYFEFLKG